MCTAGVFEMEMKTFWFLRAHIYLGACARGGVKMWQPRGCGLLPEAPLVYSANNQRRTASMSVWERGGGWELLVDQNNCNMACSVCL